MHHLRGSRALPGQLIDGDAPDSGDVLAFSGHVDVAIAGELVGFLPDFTSALTVALSCNHHGAAARFADLAASKGEVDTGEAGIDAVAAVLDPFAVHNQ